MKQTLIHTEEIQWQDQHKFFHVVLPNETKKILNVGYTVKILSKVFDSGKEELSYKGRKTPGGLSSYESQKGTMSSSVPIADLTLFSNKKEAQIYKEILMYDDAHLEMLDYSSKLFPITPPTHGYRRTGLDIIVNGRTAQIHGSIKDIVGVSQKSDIRYRVNIYIKIEKQ